MGEGPGRGRGDGRGWRGWHGAALTPGLAVRLLLPPHTHTLTRGRAVFFARGEVARPVPGGGRGQLATDDWPDGQMAGGAGGGQWPPELDLDLMLHPPTGPTCTALPTRDPGPSLQPKAGCSKWGVRPAERVLTGHRPGRPVQAPRSLPGHDGPSPPPPSQLPLGNSPGVELTRAPQSQGPLRPPPRPRPHAATPGTVMGGGRPPSPAPRALPQSPGPVHFARLSGRLWQGGDTRSGRLHSP